MLLSNKHRDILSLLKNKIKRLEYPPAGPELMVVLLLELLLLAAPLVGKFVLCAVSNNVQDGLFQFKF